jgi:hypothetical protein
MFDLEIYEIINILGLGLGMLFGIVAQKNQFCFSGSIKDYILLKSTRRGASVVFAMMRVLEIPCQSDKIISRIEHGREI